MTPQEVRRFLQVALECTVYHAPREYGLTYQELLEVGAREGLQAGEIGDALRNARYTEAKRIRPFDDTIAHWSFFFPPRNPEYRNLDAFDFVYAELDSSARAEGLQAARIERNVLVERAVAKQIPRMDIDAAITILVMDGQFAEAEGFIRYPRGAMRLMPLILPSEQAQQANRGRQPLRDELRARAYSHVGDIIKRRTDGRSKRAEALDAFAEELDKLGYGKVRMWWSQIVSELRLSDVQTNPIAVTVLAAAIAEGALTFVVEHAKKLKLGVLGSKTFEGPKTAWRIDELARSAAAGGDSAILDPTTMHRAVTLANARQRIHAGRMLSEFPGGVPDLRPEEARESKETAERVVRSVLDWLQKYPA